jgi:hypothetical protein
MTGDNPGVLVLRREQVDVADVRPPLLLIDCEPGLLLAAERPDFIALDVPQVQPAQPLE